MSHDPRPRDSADGLNVQGRRQPATWLGGPTTSVVYDGRAASRPAPPGAPAAHPAETAAVLRHTFEFRLAGAEAQEQTCAVPEPWPGAVVAAAEAVRVFVTPGAARAGPAGPIGGIEVCTALRGGRLICSASLTDLATDDVVVIQVDVAVFRAHA
jgi:hypothetical protein